MIVIKVAKMKMEAERSILEPRNVMEETVF